MIYLRDRSSGRIHGADKHGRTFEADNLDQAGDRDEISLKEAMEAPPELLCKRCFPEGDVVEKVPEEPA